MAQTTYRANLSAKSFPLLSELFGRSVIVPGPDQNFNRQLYSPEDPDKDVGIPQIYYGHNIMPNTEGFQSIGYRTNTPPVPGVTNFANIFLLRDVNENKAYFCHTADGKNYILNAGATAWVLISTIVATGTVSVAYVNGVSYIYFANVGCYKFNFTTQLFVAVTLTSLNAALIIGITSSQGYMVAWTTTQVVWSSTIDPTDFTPSLVTGAGGGGVEGVRGVIVSCVTAPFGIVIYTTTNAVAATYSGNARYPFIFKELVDCGGVASSELVAYGSEVSAQYAYTTSGLQLVANNGTQTVFPEITDFIAGKYFEDFDENTRTFSTQVLTSVMKKKLTVISSRYLVISYGITSLTHALVYDFVQKRLGKLKINHVDCFELQLLNPEVVETPRQSIGFLQQDGTIKSVDFSVNSQYSSGVMLCGKYQYVRGRTLQLDSVELENVRAGAFFTLYDMYTLDGKNTTTVQGTLATNQGLFRKYSFRVTGLNHSLLFMGQFYIVSYLLSFNIHGRR